MDGRVSVRSCREYDPEEVSRHIESIYDSTGGPDLNGKHVLVKPNILNDTEPERCVTTHPVVLEAMIRFIMSRGGTVTVGDSPAVHRKGFRPVRSQLAAVLERTGAAWADFTTAPTEIKVGRRKVRIAAAIENTDLIISLPKFKNHELMYFTGAIKNTLGLVPGFSKAMQHGIFRDRNGFGEFLVDLNEAVLPAYFLMDGIMGMEGPGPGTKGIPVATGVLLGSTNPLALDLIASRIAGYNPLLIPTSRTALSRKKWLSDENDIIYDGPALETLVKRDFRRIPVTSSSTAGLRFLLGRSAAARKLERRPVFNRSACTGCRKCVDICPAGAIIQDPDDSRHIVLTDSKCIRCFCCAEACTDSAIDVRVKIFGV